MPAEQPIISDATADRLLGTLATVTQKVQETVVAYGPAAKDVVFGVVRVNGAGKLLIGGAGLAYLIALILVLVRTKDRWIDTEAVVLISVGGIISGMAAFVASLCLLNIWNWVAVFEPGLRIAHDIYAKAMG